MEHKKETFHYTYSSAQQEEVRSIREKYLPVEESKMERLRRLDRGATRPGTVAALTVGILSTLVFGFGIAAPWCGRTPCSCPVLSSGLSALRALQPPTRCTGISRKTAGTAGPGNPAADGGTVGIGKRNHPYKLTGRLRTARPPAHCPETSAVLKGGKFHFHRFLQKTYTEMR